MKRIFFILLLAISYTFSVEAQVNRIRGLAVITEFNDYTESETDAVIDSMLNQRSGFNLYGAPGSLNEFIRDQTNGKYDITHTVVRVRLNVNMDFFDSNRQLADGTWFWKNGAISDSVIARIHKKYPDGIPGITATNFLGKEGIFSMLILYPKGYQALGIRDDYPLFLKSDGRNVRINANARGNIGNGVKGNLFTRVMTHEALHTIFRLPDVGYPANNNIYKKSHAGSYCIMGYDASSKKHPVDICAPLLVAAIKTPIVVDIDDMTEKIYSIKSNARDTIYRYRNPRNPEEYFLFQSFIHGKWFPTHNEINNPYDTGLAIWHVKNDVSNPLWPWFRIVQADGRNLMNDESISPRQVITGTDNRILFGKVVKSVNGETNSMFRWLDGSIPGLYISDISAPGERMTFKVKGRNGTLVSSISEGSGSISPLGTVALTNGVSKTVSIVPDYGHEINNVLVDGVSQGAISSYIFANPGQSHTLSASFKFSAQKISPFAAGALWRITSYSTQDGTNVATNAIDNNASTFWRTTENNDFKHELSVNMGTNYLLSGINLVHRLVNSHNNNNVYKYDIYVSLDGENWQQVSTGYAVNFNDSHKRIIGFKPVLARHFKIVTRSSLTGSKLAEISEVEAYGARYTGLPVLNDPEISKTNWRIHAVSSAITGNPATNLIDNNIGTFWHTQTSPVIVNYPHNVDVDLGGIYNITRFRLLPTGAIENARISKYAIFVSNDGVNWGDTVSTGIWDNTATEKVVYFPPVTGRYLRLAALSEASANQSAAGSEIYIHGNLTTSLHSLDQLNDVMKVYSGKNNIIIETSRQIDDLVIVDCLGRTLYRNKFDVGKHTLPVYFKSGVYIVNSMINGNSICEKLFIN